MYFGGRGGVGRNTAIVGRNPGKVGSKTSIVGCKRPEVGCNLPCLSPYTNYDLFVLNNNNAQLANH